MRETHFIKQNKDKWAKFERNLGKGNANPDELSDLFVEITDDLSYSRTFYPNRSVRVYLNNIAQKVFYSVYKNRKGRLFKFLDFWKETVPQIIYESRRPFFLALTIFLAAAFIGVFSSYMDADFPRVILGDDYIDMTLENIDNGTPMAVYQDPNQRQMFFRIAQNNLMVATLCFMVGLFFGVGTIYVIIQNGIMLGAFQYLFIREGVYMQSFFTIWMHGAIEISCIIIAGAAGITLGSGLVFPKTLTRLQSLQLSARRGLLIMLTILPLIILAAFIEGFITRYTGASFIVRGVVIFGSFAFIISYYVVYPWMKAKKGFTSFISDVKLPPEQSSEIKYNQIKNSAQIFSDAFIFYRKIIKPVAFVSFLLAAIYTLILLWDGDSYSFQTITSIEQFLENPWALPAYTLENVSQFLLVGDFSIPWILNYITSGVMAYLVLFWVQKDANKAKNTKYGWLFFLKTITATFISMFVIHSFLLAVDGWLFLLIVFVVPILLMILATVFNENINLISGIARSISVVSGNWVVMMGAYLVITIMCLIFLFMATAPIAGFYLGVIVNAFPITDLALVRQGFYIFLYSYMLSFLFPLVFVVMGVGFFSFRETKEATDLLEQIPNVGIRKISYGMEKEN
ncbi:stage II sporulation protein M [Aureispira anguillae]|uniref:Stage II sporulation protein M n=1 Tax=Aureispira anguillae TaxID=2864201 RepID=A0A915YJZ2_9BACT|nr:stage II sporulation protein M [Aureispira anguillae]BDS14630.1 stage II sporulation protein M [Aureispira anguillae]